MQAETCYTCRKKGHWSRDCPSNSNSPNSKSLSPSLSHYSPELVRRMQADNCYTCKEKGHWSWDCPSKSPNSRSISPSASHYSPDLVRRMQTDNCYTCKEKGHWSWDCPLNSPNAKPPSQSAKLCVHLYEMNTGTVKISAEMDKSMENSLTLDEFNKRFEEEKDRVARVQGDCFNTETLLEVSNQRRELLIEEISHLEAMLYEKQTQLKSCELENLQIETHLGELRRNLMEADTILKVTAEEATIARQLNKERQAKQISAKTALEKAKLEFEN